MVSKCSHERKPHIPHQKSEKMKLIQEGQKATPSRIQWQN